MSEDIHITEILAAAEVLLKYENIKDQNLITQTKAEILQFLLKPSARTLGTVTTIKNTTIATFIIQRRQTLSKSKKSGIVH